MNQELIKEARAYIVNGLLAYGEAFELLPEENIDQETVNKINEALEQVEAIIPVLVSMWEMTKKISGEDISFMEWLEQMARNMGEKGAGPGLF